ncbi:PilZ domain-containing protein [bacterium]|nr:PilZ domain-containing protein [bacterium]
MGKKITSNDSWAVERRKGKRAHLNVLVEFKICDKIGKHTKRYKSATINLSGDGILINAVHLPDNVLAHLIQQESCLAIEIFLSISSHPIKAKGKVVWITRDKKEKGDYGLGVKFISINEKDRIMLIESLAL